jgi:hypothetical protein
MLPCAADQWTEPLEIFLYYLRRASMTIPLLLARPRVTNRFGALRWGRSRLPLRRGPAKIRQLELHRLFARWSVRHSLAGEMVESAPPFAFRSRRGDRAIATRYESPKARYPTHRPDISLDRLCSRRLGHMISFIFPAMTEDH